MNQDDSQWTDKILNDFAKCSRLQSVNVIDDSNFIGDIDDVDNDVFLNDVVTQQRLREKLLLGYDMQRSM